MLGQAFCQKNAGDLLAWCQSLATLSLWCQRSISCLFDLGSDWPVRPLMQVDKAVIHQFSLSLPFILHKPLSTCGMVSQHLDGAWLGFKWCWSQYIPSEMPQTQWFWTFSVSHAGNTVGAGSWFLPCQAGIGETHTTNQQWPLPWIC